MLLHTSRCMPTHLTNVLLADVIQQAAFRSPFFKFDAIGLVAFVALFSALPIGNLPEADALKFVAQV